VSCGIDKVRNLVQGCLQKNSCSVIGLLLIGLILRLVAALFTYGTEDVASWGMVGETLLRGENPYRYTYFLRWPSLWMVTIFAIKHLSLALRWDFATLIKIPPIIADVAIPVVIFCYFTRKYGDAGKGRVYALLYAINPVPILITAVHGQFDAVPALFLLLSLYFVDRYEEVADLFVSAIFLGLAIFAKSWPLLMVPFFLAHVSGRKPKAAFLVTSLLPFLVSVATLYALTPADVYYKVGQYKGLPGWWGFTSFFNVVQHPATKFISDLYARIGNYVLLLALAGMYIAYYRLRHSRSQGLLEALVGGILLIYVLTPGYGTQYLAWIVPFVIMYSCESKTARYFLVLASLELLIEYVFRPYTGVLGEWVLKSRDLRSEAFHAAYGSPTDVTVTNLLRWPLWICCGLFLATILRGWQRSAAGEACPLPGR
jgi:hypothetical protein